MKVYLILWSVLFGPLVYADSFKAVAIGDSITAGFNAGGFFTQKENSWSTGDSENVLSHRDLIEDALNVDVESYNFAVAGSRIDDLRAQVDEVVRVDPDYVTLLIGANDVCKWGANYFKDLEHFEKNLTLQLKRIIEKNSSVRILLVSIPDLYRLWEVGSAKNGCQARWSMFGICKAMLGKDQTDLERLEVAERWLDTNQVLASVAESFPDHIKFSESVQDFKFIEEDISKIDCFHPSLTGQNMLSETTWKEGWFHRD